MITKEEMLKANDFLSRIDLNDTYMRDIMDINRNKNMPFYERRGICMIRTHKKKIR